MYNIFVTGNYERLDEKIASPGLFKLLIKESQRQLLIECSAEKWGIS